MHSNRCLVKGHDHAASRCYAETHSNRLYYHYSTCDHYRDGLGHQAFRHASQPDSRAVDEPGELCHWRFSTDGDLAPDFKLTDQFGHSVTLSSLRGHEVVLAF